MRNLVQRVGSERLDLPTFFWGCAGPVVGISMGLGSFFWLLSIGDGGGESPLTLAQISATLGGLVLVGALVDAAAPSLRKDLYRVALLLIIAAVAFAVIGLVLPAGQLISSEDSLLYVHTSIGAFGLVVGMVAFSWAIGGLISVLAKLLRHADQRTG